MSDKSTELFNTLSKYHKLTSFDRTSIDYIVNPLISQLKSKNEENIILTKAINGDILYKEALDKIKLLKES